MKNFLVVNNRSLSIKIRILGYKNKDPYGKSKNFLVFCEFHIFMFMFHVFICKSQYFYTLRSIFFVICGSLNVGNENLLVLKDLTPSYKIRTLKVR